MKEMIDKVLSEEVRAGKLVEQAREKASATTSEAGKRASAIIEEARNEAREIILEAQRKSEEEAEEQYKAAIDLAAAEAEKFKSEKISFLMSAAEEALNFLIAPPEKSED
jgi:vacuolar-type H+-ATPase subunit H